MMHMMHMLDHVRLLEAHQFSVFKLLQGILGFFRHPRTSAASHIFAARCVQVIEWIIVIWGSTFQVLSMPILGGAAHFVIHAFMGFFQKPWSDVVGSLPPQKKTGSRVPYDTHPRINRSFTGNHGLYHQNHQRYAGFPAGFPSNSGKGWVLDGFGAWILGRSADGGITSSAPCRARRPLRPKRGRRADPQHGRGWSWKPGPAKKLGEANVTNHQKHDVLCQNIHAQV